MRTTITLSALLVAAPLWMSAQTTHRPVHHTTTIHHASTACSLALPEMSPKIPALPAGVSKCPTIEYALSYIDLKVGTGELAQPRKFYTVHYTGYLPDGTKFDSSLDRNEPITFPYGAHRVITGWDTGFEGMHVGGKRRLFVPYQLAYGELGRPPVIPPKSMLIFDLELISQSDTPPAPKAPPAAATPPASAPKPPTGTTPPAATPPAPTPNTTSPAGTAASPPVTSTTPTTANPSAPATKPQ